MSVLLSMALMPATQQTLAQSPDVPPGRRSMWVWTTDKILASQAETNRLVNGAVAAGATDVFLFITSRQYTTRHVQLRQLIGALRKSGVLAWGMEGYRGYFSDVHGPKELYRALDALVAYNRKAPMDERFVGFHADLEPQDGQGIGPNAFTNGKPYSALTARQKGLRDALMADWVNIYLTLRSRTRSAGIRFGASFPSWVDDYEGQPVTFVDTGVRKPVLGAMMALVDDYVAMSYNTDPHNAAHRVAGELAHASALKDQNRPHPSVQASVETHAGVGAMISYGDHPTKSTKPAVVADMDVIHSMLRSYSAYSGIAIHDWEGWRLLAPNSTHTAGPVPVARSTPPSLTGWRPQ